MTNRNNTTLYTGITNDLKRRVYEHKEKMVGGFTKKYNINKLVYYEMFDDPCHTKRKTDKGWIKTEENRANK